MGYKHNIDTIVKKGMRLFEQRGYHAVGINDILKACAIPKGSFYNFFDSKEQLWLRGQLSLGESFKFL